MAMRNLMALISTTNDYSVLKWPLMMVCVLITLESFLLLLGFRSNSWFQYELTNIDNDIINAGNVSKVVNTKLEYSHMLETGSFGLWSLCTGHQPNWLITCDSWTKETRPQSFNIILILSSVALFISNITIFPSWATLILLLYNINNYYMRYITVFIWIVLLLISSFTAVLIGVLVLIGFTQFYSPGVFIMDAKRVVFHSSTGVVYMVVVVVLSIICLITSITTIIWKKFIEMKLAEDEKELYKQLTDETFQPGWSKVIMVPRDETSFEDVFGEPPPYDNRNT